MISWCSDYFVVLNDKFAYNHLSRMQKWNYIKYLTFWKKILLWEVFGRSTSYFRGQESTDFMAPYCDSLLELRTLKLVIV